MKKSFLFGLFVLINSIALAADPAGKLKIVMTDFRNDKGSAKIALFNSKEGFPNDDGKALKRAKVKIENGKTEVVFNDISYGTYAIAAYHDENKNSIFDKNWLGIPKEGYGVSNNANPAMRPPYFDEAKFQLNSGGKVIFIKIEY